MRMRIRLDRIEKDVRESRDALLIAGLLSDRMENRLMRIERELFELRYAMAAGKSLKAGKK